MHTVCNANHNFIAFKFVFPTSFFLFKLNKNKAKTNKKPILCNMRNRKNVKTNEFCIS